jgi:CheY-like chemotaxis protein
MAWSDIRVSEAVHGFLQRTAAASPHVDGLWLVPPDGRTANSADFFPFPDISVTDRTYFQALRERDELHYGEMIVGRIKGNFNFNLSRRRFPRDIFNGVILVTSSLSYFTDFWEQASEGPFVAGIFREDGEILVRYPLLGRCRGRLSEDSPLLDQMQESDDNVYQSISSLDGRARIYGYSRIGETPLFIGYGVPNRHVLANWRNEMLRMGLVALMATALLGIAAATILRQNRSLGATAVSWRRTAEELEREVDKRLRAEDVAAERKRLLDEVRALTAQRQSILENMAEGVIALDARGCIIYANREAMSSSDPFRGDRNSPRWSTRAGSSPPTDRTSIRRMRPTGRRFVARPSRTRVSRAQPGRSRRRLLLPRRRDPRCRRPARGSRPHLLGCQRAEAGGGTPGTPDARAGPPGPQHAGHDHGHDPHQQRAAAEQGGVRGGLERARQRHGADAWHPVGRPVEGRHDRPPRRRRSVSAADARQLVLEGDREVMLPPKEAADLALALHELATNATKHGAWSVPEGRVALRWQRDREAGRPILRVRWKETGGPAIARAPERRGFGSILLQGIFAGEQRASVAYEPDGLRCTMSVPILDEGRAAASAEPPAVDAPPEAGQGSLAGLRILVVEDEAIVRLDLVQILRDAGATMIAEAGSLEEGLARAEETPVDAAILDRNLNGKGSEPVARLLAERGAAIIFVSGYGSAPRGTGPGSPGHANLQKPVSPATLVTTLASAVAARRARS